MRGSDAIRGILTVGIIVGASPARASDNPSIERAMTALIDDHLARAWLEAGVQPAPQAEDAEYLRRVSLDLTGAIPKVSEARGFLEDTDPEKRRKLAARLLKNPLAANHFVNTWRSLLIPELATGGARTVGPDFDRWLRNRFAESAGFDAIARELLSVGVDNINPMGPGTEPGPVAFYAAKEYQPEELAASTARVFLGVRIECAQCHDHPFATWKRDQFWELAASFASVARPRMPNAGLRTGSENKKLRELKIPGTGRTVKARFLDGTEVSAQAPSAREALAGWITSADNPYFARTIVNRVWARLMGEGIVEPVDDFSESNLPSHPEVLDELARRFLESGSDHSMLIRAIVGSRAYQLTSKGSVLSDDGPRLFDRMKVKGLSGEQWYDSLNRAVGSAPEPPGVNNALFNQPTSRRSLFLEKFASKGDRMTDRPTSILQAMTLMNGPMIAQATDPNQGPTLGAVLNSPFLDLDEKIETLYLAALSRYPRPDERARMTAHVDLREANAGLADLFWALLNSAEFAFNH